MAARSSGADGKSSNPATQKSPPAKPRPTSMAKPSSKATPTGGRPHQVRSRFWTRGLQYGLVLAMLLAPVAAYFIQLVRVPEEIAPTESQIRTRPLSSLIAGAIASPQTISLEFSADEINEHLAQLLQATRKSNTAFPFQRVAIRMEPERCHVLAKYRLDLGNLHTDMHLHVTYSVSVQDGKLKARAFTAQVGRVRLGAYWMRKLEENWLRRLQGSFKREFILLNRLETLRLEPGRALLKLRPSSAASSP